jgi:hypothetical protein
MTFYYKNFFNWKCAVITGRREYRELYSNEYPNDTLESEFKEVTCFFPCEIELVYT